MADEIKFTPQPVRITAAGQVMPLADSIDVSEHDTLDLLEGCMGVEGASPSATVDIITGMRTDSEDGWVSVSTAFAAKTAANTWEKKQFVGLLKYARWKCTAFDGTAVTIDIRGMARKNS